MGARPGVAVLVFGAALCAPALARAQLFDARPSVAISGGYNVTEILFDSPALAPIVQNFPLLALSPAIALSYETPLTVSALNASANLVAPLASGFQLADGPPKYTLKASYAGKFTISPLSRLDVNLSAGAAPVNAYGVLGDPAQTSFEANPADTAYHLTFTGTETFRRDFTPDLDLRQTTNAVYTYPYGVDPIRPATLTVKSSVAATQHWALDRVTLTATVGYTRFGVSEATDGEVVDPRSSLLNTLVASWQRPITEALTLGIDLGVEQALSADLDGTQLYQPTAAGHLVYHYDTFTAALALNHGAAINVYTATTNLTDQASLRLTLPISARYGVASSASAGYTHSTPIAADSAFAAGFDASTADVSLSYSPEQIPKLMVSARGNVLRQAPVGDPLGGVTRLGFVLHVGFSYPSARAHEANTRIAISAYTPTPDLPAGPPPGEDAPAAPDEEPSAPEPEALAPPASAPK